MLYLVTNRFLVSKTATKNKKYVYKSIKSIRQHYIQWERLREWEKLAAPAYSFQWGRLLLSSPATATEAG